MTLTRACALTAMIFAISFCAMTSADADEKKADKPAATETKPADAEKAPPKTIDESKKEWAHNLSGADLIGFYTTDGQEPGDQKPDRYRLASVSVAQDDRWIFTYVHSNIPIPLALQVKMAGDTPVIIMDEFTIAGMGTFSARIMFHGDRYAGTWQHGKVGGLMFGRIETAATRKAKAEQGAAPNVKPATAPGR